MGNTITNRGKSRNGSPYTPSIFNKCSLQRKRKSSDKQHYELRSKTLPASNRYAFSKRNDLDKPATQTLPIHKPQISSTPPTPPPPNGETSRVLFLLYLIHRTWNVITDTKSKSSHGKVFKKPSYHDSFYETESNCSLSLADLYGTGSQCCSQLSVCSCTSCYNDDVIAEQNVYNSIDEKFSQDSIGDKVESLSKSQDNTEVYKTANENINEHRYKFCLQKL